MSTHCECNATERVISKTLSIYEIISCYPGVGIRQGKRAWGPPAGLRLKKKPRKERGCNGLALWAPNLANSASRCTPVGSYRMAGGRVPSEEHLDNHRSSLFSITRRGSANRCRESLISFGFRPTRFSNGGSIFARNGLLFDPSSKSFTAASYRSRSASVLAENTFPNSFSMISPSAYPMRKAMRVPTFPKTA